MSRKRIPLNQNGCTATFRIGVPFEQNLQLCDYRNIEIIEGAVCADHVHLCLSIPPSEKVSDVIAYIKGKSALMIHDKYPEMVNGWSKSFWARGYYVATVGNITEEAVKEYIQQQKEESKREDTRR